MRAILFAVYVFIAFWAIRAALRRMIQLLPRSGATAGEMVLDPQCRIYVLKEQAVTRRIGGDDLFFCSEGCATAHAAGKQG